MEQTAVIISRKILKMLAVFVVIFSFDLETLIKTQGKKYNQLVKKMRKLVVIANL